MVTARCSKRRRASRFDGTAPFARRTSKRSSPSFTLCSAIASGASLRWTVRSNRSSASVAASSPQNSETMVRASSFFVSIGLRRPASSARMISLTSERSMFVASTKKSSSTSSGSDIALPYCSSGESLTPMWLPTDFDMRAFPSRPTRIGMVIGT